jgi:hypothetical protein
MAIVRERQHNTSRLCDEMNDLMFQLSAQIRALPVSMAGSRLMAP